MKPTGYLEQYNKMLTADDMVFMGGHKTISLNGDWNYAVDQYDTCLRQKWFEEHYVNQAGLTFPVDYSFDTWPVMQLPCSSNLFAEQLFLYEAPLVFTRRFVTPEDADHVILRIGAANYATRIFVNGKLAGFHRGGSTPMFADITDLLNTEEDCENSQDANVLRRGLHRNENRILIVTDATRRAEQVPALETDWFNYAGIYRDIDLLVLPKLYIKTFETYLVPDGTYSNIKVRAELSEKADAFGTFTCAQTAQNDALTVEVNIKNGVAEAVIPFKPMLWSPEHPNLYDVRFVCEKENTEGGRVSVDCVTDRVGYREIRVKGHDILLNGESIFLRGVCMHEDSRYTGKALTTEERRQGILDAREMGCNFMRVAHYPHSEEMSRLADEMGMMLWEEIPVYWGIAFGDPDTYEDAENQLRELILRDMNRASVIIWSVGNENQDMDDRLKFMSSLSKRAHAMDETRLVSAACLVDGYRNQINDRLAAYLDVIGINEYYGWYDPDFSRLPQLFENSKPDKPVIITEFGADAMPGHHGAPDEKGTLECQEEVFKRQAAVLPGIPYIRGTSPWILYDFRCPRRTSSIQLYYNRKGLIADDRVTRKPAFYVMQKLYREEL